MSRNHRVQCMKTPLDFGMSVPLPYFCIKSRYGIAAPRENRQEPPEAMSIRGSYRQVGLPINARILLANPEIGFHCTTYKF
jgi:hypothetical protein